MFSCWRFALFYDTLFVASLLIMTVYPFFMTPVGRLCDPSLARSVVFDHLTSRAFVIPFYWFWPPLLIPVFM